MSSTLYMKKRATDKKSENIEIETRTHGGIGWEDRMPFSVYTVKEGGREARNESRGRK